MSELRFAMVGAGFWAKYQLAGWQEVAGARCVAVCDQVEGKAEALAHTFGISTVYRSVEAMLEAEPLDFLDVAVGGAGHPAIVMQAAAHHMPVICQKPMASSLAQAEEMVETCRASETPFFVHENWRWQAPIREIKRVLDQGGIGRPFRARISMVSGFPVFVNQPFFKNLKQFLLTDMGSHLLDTTRFLFGEAQRLTCETQRVHADIEGEDVATVLMRMGETVVVCEMGYAENYLERDCFPQTNIFIEAERGSLELAPDYWVRETTADGTHARRHPPHHFAWADPAYDLGQSSIVPCHQNLLSALRGEGQAETTGEDNLKTVRLVFAAYESARRGETLTL